MKRILILSTMVAIVATASAQVNSNLKLRVGASYPLENTTRRVTGNMIGVGVDFGLQRPLLAKGESFISIDWLGKSSGGAKGNIFPIAVNHRWWLDEKRPVGNRQYFFAGIGFANIDVTKAKTVYAGRLGLGVELTEHVSFDVIGVVSDEANNARANSIGVYIGWKF